MEIEARKVVSAEMEQKLDKMLASSEFKTFLEKTKAAEDTGTFEVVISDETLDRMGEIIKLEGWETERYMMNPVVLWGHESWKMPIGITTSLEKRDGKLIAKGKFAPEDANPQAQHVRRLYDLGIQRATSVGFIEKEREGNMITKAELLEFSFVSVPANPMCLSTLVKSSININEMVTKGLIFVKEEGEQAPVEEETPTEETTPAEESGEGLDNTENNEGSKEAPEGEPTEEELDEIETEEGSDELDEGINEDLDEEERGLNNTDNKALGEIVGQFKSAIIALEELVKSQEPEGNSPDSVSDEDVRAYKEFSAKRRLLQEAATVLGEVLAESRQAIEARKK